MLLKKENKELRGKMRALNDRLTTLLEGMKLVPKQKPFSMKLSMDTMENEIRNADTRIDILKKEIAFLSKKLQEVGGVDQIESLEQETASLRKNEEELTARLKLLRNKNKVLALKEKKIDVHNPQETKASSIVDKTKLFTVKQSRLEQKNQRLKSEIQIRRNFTDKLNKRYMDACSTLGAKPELQLSYNPEDLAQVKVDTKKLDSKRVARSAVISSLIKKRQIGFSQSLLMDDPDNYEMPQAEEDFQRLKQKVLYMNQSARVEYKKTNITKKAAKSKTSGFDGKVASYGIQYLR